MGRACNTNGRDEKCIRYFVGKPEGKIPLGRPRRRCEDNIRMDLKEIGWEGVDCMRLAQDRDQWRILVNTVINSIKGGEFCDWLLKKNFVPCS